MIPLFACLILIGVGNAVLKDLGEPPTRPDLAHLILFGVGVVTPYGVALIGLTRIALT